MKNYPYSKLLEDWAEVINTVIIESKTLSNPKKKKLMLLFLRKLRMPLIAFFAPIKCKWWDTKKIELTTDKGMRFAASILDEDRSMYQLSITRMLAADIWSVIEGYFRESSSESIKKILSKKFGEIPPAINTLRLLKNCNHNYGIHTGKGSDASFLYKVGAWKFKFRNGKAIKNFHPPAIIALINEAIIEVINMKEKRASVSSRA